jgi:hypothetical protein
MEEVRDRMKCQTLQRACGIYSRLRNALYKLVPRRSRENVTETMDQALAEIGEQSDPFADSAVRQRLQQIEW